MAEVTQQQPRQHIRLALLISILVALFLVGRYTGVAENMDAESIRELVRGAGAWGWALYIAIFAGGEFIHIPGMVFVLAGILIYGQVIGFGLAWMASVVSVCFSFVVVRRLGGTPLGNVEKPWVKRILGRLNAQPIRTVVVLRLVLWLAPPLNYALALTNVRFRDYLIGSALGLIAPVAGVAVLFDWLFGAS
jgi:uncharacterized membrane protein YdjX (TVP38/TMEM64 family)